MFESHSVKILESFLDRLDDIVACVKGSVLEGADLAAHYGLELFDVLAAVSGIGEFNAKEIVWMCVPRGSRHV